MLSAPAAAPPAGPPDRGTTGSILAALAVALLLAVLRLLAPKIRGLPFVPERATGSFGGGLAVAYVFLHLLPELAEGNKAVGQALQEVVQVTPLLDLGIFLVALAGFLLFYGLERLAQRSTAPAGGRTGSEPSDRSMRQLAGIGTSRGSGRLDTRAASSPTPAGDGEQHPVASPLAFRLHLASFFVYNGLITYTMALRFRTGVVFALLFTTAMGLHFVLTDRGLEEHYGARFNRAARALLAAGLLLGCALAALFAPSSVLVVSLLTAFLGGSILLNVFKEELPSNRQSSFGWFTVGLTGYALLLAVTTYFAE